MLGKTYLQLSEESLKKINEIDPNSVVAHEIAGEIDESMHNYDVALVEYKKAIDLAPHEPGTHMHMGNAYWLIGKWESAQEEFKAELVNDPNNCTARWKLANAMLEANDSSEDALAQLNQAVERCPDFDAGPRGQGACPGPHGKAIGCVARSASGGKGQPHVSPAFTFCSEPFTERRERPRKPNRRCAPMGSCRKTPARPSQGKPTMHAHQK